MPSPQAHKAHWPLSSMEIPAFLFPSTLIILLLFASYYPRPVISAAHNNFTDLSALLAFKANVGDPLGLLAGNWTTNASFCSWVGVGCSRRRQRVTALRLIGLSLHGTISPHLANLSFLQHLNLANNTLGGPIPDSLGRLTRLAFLGLHQNQLSGPIPPGILNMSSLIRVSFAHNNLSGPLPQGRSLHVPQLQWISFEDNHFIGSIPAGLASSPELTFLSLGFNQLTGKIPAALGNLTKLTLLSLAVNQLTGKIPAALGNLTKLEVLNLGNNSLHGGVPLESGSLPSLQQLHLAANSLTGPIPVSLCNASMLSRLELSNNELTGPVPAQLGRNAPLLQFLNLQFNRLHGGLDFLTSLSSCRVLETLAFGFNELDGVIPDSVGNLSTYLLRFVADENRIRGPIPAGIGNLSSLWYLGLGGNYLTGVVPPSLQSLRTLEVLALGSNRLDGPIPHELGQLRSLNGLDLGANALVGRIPDSIGNISRLQFLSLSTNGLRSAIPRSIWSLTELTSLDLSSNSLDGLLGPEVGNLRVIDFLDLSSNHLSGIIPNGLGGINMITSLNLSHNSFHGLIPRSFGQLINIKRMDLSYNGLSGAIPESLVGLRYLTALNLSYNRLEGQVPEGGVFSNLTIQYLVGNAALCGVSRLGFSPCSTNGTIPRDHSRATLRLITLILPILASTIALVACICLVLQRRRRMERRAKTPGTTNASPVNDHRLISYHELARATDNFSEANLLGRGSFGSVYRGHLDDGLSVAVKVLNLEIEGASRSFDAECRALRMLRHRNLVKIVTTCSNLDFKALVLQFMPGGSLERFLYSHNYCLSLLQRMSIMMDVALALEYLHDHNVLHCDLKPSNVLLDQNMVAHVADFGIAKLLVGDSKSVASTGTPGTIGYIAPEYGSTGRVSKRSDVYSYGIVLLETFTRKKPSDGSFDGESTLQQWVCKAHPAMVKKVVDINLLGDDHCDDEPSDNLGCLISIIELGLLCSTESPKERISIKDIVLRLERIKKEYVEVM